jgi:hypothetical protein
MLLFLISDEQLLEMYDCVMDCDLKRFELVLSKVKTDQALRVDDPPPLKLDPKDPPKENDVL